MSRTVEAVLVELQALLPEGWAWDREGDLAALLTPLARRHATLEAEAEALLAEVDPRAADALLVDYERVLGPDPCGRDLLLTTLADRRAAAHQRWVASGQPTPAFFVALAAQLGLPTAVVEEYLPPQCGAAECGGAECSLPGQVFAWRITLPPDRLIEAECGVSECGDLLGDFVPPLAECVIRGWAPAHTTPVFDYSGSYV